MVCGQDVVLLAGFGGPESMADVEPFLRSILTGRPIPAERMAKIVARYESVGGYSPFCAEVRDFAERLETLLADTGVEMPVRTTYLHSSPRPELLVQSLQSTPIRRIYVQILTPFAGYEAYDKYVERINMAFQAARSSGLAPELRFLPVLCEEPNYIKTVTEQIQKYAAASPAVDRNLRPRLLFTAHSVPMTMPDRERYQGQMERTANQIVHLLKTQPVDNYQVTSQLDLDQVWIAWQSRSGRPDQPWLGPSPVEVVRRERGSWLVIPLGFLFENLELTYDLDQELSEAIAERSEDRYTRLQAVGSQPGVVRVVAKNVLLEIMRAA